MCVCVCVCVCVSFKYSFKHCKLLSNGANAFNNIKVANSPLSVIMLMELRPTAKQSINLSKFSDLHTFFYHNYNCNKDLGLLRN